MNDPTNSATELMCLGGPLHGRLQPRGMKLTMDVDVKPRRKTGELINETVSERHTYALSTFHYSPDEAIMYWRHQPLDAGRAAQFAMLDFLKNRPTLRIAMLYAGLKAVEQLASESPLVPARSLAAVVVPVLYPQEAQRIAESVAKTQPSSETKN